MGTRSDDRTADPTGPAPTVPAPNPTPQRLGVHVAGSGIDIAVVAEHATRVDFCVINEGGPRFERRWSLRGPDTGVWHGHLDAMGEGLHYGFRVHGPWDPDGGLFHNPAKLLIDPYTRGLEGSLDLGPEVHAHQVDDDLYPTTYPLVKSDLDSAGHVPTSVVVGHHFDVAEKPRIPWNRSVIYELHVKGFTKNLPGVPAELRGTYAGLAHPRSIDHLHSLGVTAVELLPVHAKLDESFLSERGLTNYWGYSTLNFFTPEPSYATAAARARGAQAVVDEFRGMVSILHLAGIEVLLDVVYNHTCEGNDSGPSLSWRGLDSTLYYRHTPSRPMQMVDVTGTGNTVDFDHPRSMQMVLDSLRYWSGEMGVDGFRFDLAATLGRFSTGFTPLHPLLVAMATDEDLSLDKLIAEPWDVGPGGWQTGNFPAPFSEWNDRFRDSARGFWLSDLRNLVTGRWASGPNELATRLSGSADVFTHGPGRLRGPRASVNFVTAHDGFTLADLTAYDHKHNMANLEGNRDGSSNNLSWNHGLEGAVASSLLDTDARDAAGIVEDIFPARQRSQRNLLTTMLVSAGTPMITAGDEFQRTQYGNNNAYCQDGPISWLDWDLSRDQLDQVATTRWLLSLRRCHPVLRPETFATGVPVPGDTIADVGWYTRKGTGMPQGGWSREENRVFQMLRSGLAHGDRDALVVVNGTSSTRKVTLAHGHGLDWLVVMDTSWSAPSDGGIDVSRDIGTLPSRLERVGTGTTMRVEPLSMLVLLSVEPPTPTDARVQPD
ncbi:glycogen debranching protein GlgX [Actinomyces sp.]|uniref:glycogen debranching protein GlgX n=1 Tax=Actinomyces sp. TaxID=29317 RepID=UPI0028A14B3B|nr:glycogen debranching protein GlgX [Actinomyces sp.]